MKSGNLPLQKPTPARYDRGRIVGWIIQAGLGFLVGFSSLQCLQYLKCFNIKLPYDDISILLVSMAVIVAAAPLSFLPKLKNQLPLSIKVLSAAGLVWYGIFSAISYIRFHRGFFWESADKPQTMAAIALIALPVALLIIILSNRSCKCRTLPIWCLALLAFGIWGLPFNMQLGQLPICALSFVIAFQAAFLARGLRFLLLSIISANLLLLALSLCEYMMFLPGLSLSVPRFGGFAMAGPSFTGHYLILITALSAALLISANKKSARYPLYIITAFFLFCLILTQSRGALIGLVAGAFFFIFQVVRKHRLNRYLVIGLIVFTMLAAFFVVHLTIQRQATEERGIFLVWAMQEFVKHPILGNGIGWWHSTYTDHVITEGISTDQHFHCHNIIFEIMCGSGLLGLLIFGIIFYCGAKIYIHARGLLQSPQERNMMIICAAGIFGYIISMIVDVLFWNQALMPAIPVMIGAWMGYIASKDDAPTAGNLFASKPQRCLYPIMLVAGLMLISAISARYLPTYYSSYKEKLKHRQFDLADPGELPFGDIQGCIIDKQGRPIKGVKVSLQRPFRESLSDEKGIFEIKHIKKTIPGKEPHIKFFAPGYRTGDFKVMLVEHGPTKLGIMLDRAQ